MHFWSLLTTNKIINVYGFLVVIMLFMYAVFHCLYSVGNKTQIQTQTQTAAAGRGTHYMKFTTYAPPFPPPFFRSLENLYSFDPYILAKMGKMSYFDPYFSSKLGKMYSFHPLFWPLKRFELMGGAEHPYLEPDRVAPPSADKTLF